MEGTIEETNITMTMDEDPDEIAGAHKMMTEIAPAHEESTAGIDHHTEREDAPHEERVQGGHLEKNDDPQVAK